MTTTPLQEILAFLLGRKYYANIVNRRGVVDKGLCEFIFRTKEQAEQHKNALTFNRSFEYIETISFRSRKEYACKYKPE